MVALSPKGGRSGHKGKEEKSRRRRSRKGRRRRRARRGRSASQRAEAKSTASLRIFTNNIRGFTSKQESLTMDVINKLRPDVINLSETLKKGKAEIKIKDYVTFSQNRPNNEGGGGISTLVSTMIKKYATKVAADNENGY